MVTYLGLEHYTNFFAIMKILHYFPIRFTVVFAAILWDSVPCIRLAQQRQMAKYFL